MIALREKMHLKERIVLWLFRRVAEVAMCGRNIRYFFTFKKRKMIDTFLCIYTNDDLTPFAKKNRIVGE